METEGITLLEEHSKLNKHSLVSRSQATFTPRSGSSQTETSPCLSEISPDAIDRSAHPLVKALGHALFWDVAPAGLPTCRGKIHLLLLYASPFWILLQYMHCRSALAYLAVSISVACSLLNFGFSFSLHNFDWSSAWTRVLLRKLDHCGIFLMIAGSCAPVPMLLFPRNMKVILLVVQWISCAAGVGAILFGRGFSSSRNTYLRTIVYCVIGLSNVAFSFEFVKVTNYFETSLLLVLAALYVVGSSFYALKFPRLVPTVFGYHELFHTFCLLAFVATVILNCSVLDRAS